MDSQRNANKFATPNLKKSVPRSTCQLVVHFPKFPVLDFRETAHKALKSSIECRASMSGGPYTLAISL
jgi:hypothetical protein